MVGARHLLAARGITDPSIEALTGAIDEIDHRLLIRQFLIGVSESGK
jgi:hypothetical protein